MGLGRLATRWNAREREAIRALINVGGFLICVLRLDLSRRKLGEAESREVRLDKGSYAHKEKLC